MIKVLLDSMENEKLHLQHTGFESTEVPTEQVENVIAATVESVRHCRLHPDEAEQILSKLYDRVSKTELKGIFEDYKEHNIVTIDDLKSSIDIVLKQLEMEMTEDETDETIKQGYQLLKNRGQEIERVTKRYAYTVSKFFHIQKQQFRLEPADYNARLQDIDNVRRIAHDGLIETLTIYTRTINNLDRQGVLGDVEVTQWRHNDRFNSAQDTEGKVFVFSAEVLQDRDLVKDWAISANIHNSAQEIMEIREKASNHKESDA